MDLNYLKSKAVYVITALISIFLVMYIGFQMKITADDDIYTEVVDIKKMSLFTEISGYMFLDEEELYLKDSDGVWIPEVSAGTFVDKGKMIGAVYGADDVPIAQRIAAIDEKILLLEACMKANQGIIGSKEYDKAVSNSYLSLMSAADEGDLFNVRQEMRNRLLSKGKRDVAISVVTSFKNEINTLKNQRAELLQTLGEGAPVKTNKTGRYYPESDGYGSYFSYDIAKSGSYSMIDGLLSGASRLDNEKDGSVACGRMVYSTKWYFVSPMDEDVAKLFVQGSVYMMSFEENGGKSLPLYYERTVKTLGNSVVYGVFYCNEMPADFSFVRFQNVKVKTVDYEGLCIPASSVRFVDGMIGVYIAKGSKAEFRRVKIIGEMNGSYIIKGADMFTKNDEENAQKEKYLTRYDTVITSGKNIYEGKYIDMSKIG